MRKRAPDLNLELFAEGFEHNAPHALAVKAVSLVSLDNTLFELRTRAHRGVFEVVVEHDDGFTKTVSFEWTLPGKFRVNFNEWDVGVECGAQLAEEGWPV